MKARCALATLFLLSTFFLDHPLLAAPPEAAFYVAPNGSDKWSGRLAEPNANRTDGPFATLGRARDAVRELRAKVAPKKPIAVLVRGGRYELAEPLTFTFADSGTAAAPTRLAMYPGEKPILSGGLKITGWKRGADGVWSAALPKSGQPWRARQISVNGQVRHRPRLPKSGFYVINGLAGADPKGKYDTPANKFEFKDGEIKANWKNLNDVEVVILHFWVDTHFKIASVDEKAHVVNLDRFSRRKLTDDYQNRLARYYITNVAEALTEPGEFYIDISANTIRYLPKQGEDMTKAEVVVPRLQSVVRFDGDARANKTVEHIELSGLTFSDSTWEPDAKHAVDSQAASEVPGAVWLRAARQCAITDCRLVNLGGYGIELAEGSRNNRIIGNELTHLGAGGIRLGGGDAKSPEQSRTGENQITDNHLHHLGELFHSGVGVLAQHTDNNVIAHNHIHHLYYTGISVGWVWGYGPSVSRGNRVEDNRIHDVGQKMLSDMGGIYLLGNQPDAIIRGNVIHDIDSWTYGGWGIYTDEGSTGILIENNLVYRTKSGGFHQHYGRDNIVRNNIFALAREEQIVRSRAENHKSFTFEHNIVWFKDGPLFSKVWQDDAFTVDHNLYWNASGKPIAFPGGSLEKWRERGHDRNSLIADPKFRDPEKGDFTLAQDSPALKVGFKPFDVSKVGPRKRHE